MRHIVYTMIRLACLLLYMGVGATFIQDGPAYFAYVVGGSLLSAVYLFTGAKQSKDAILRKYHLK